MAEHGAATPNAEELKPFLGTDRKPDTHLEGVLSSVRRPGDFTYKVCKRANCKLPFGTNYTSVGYCSDICRIRDFEDLTGCKWNPHKTDEERWGGEPPLIIPPKVLAVLYPFARRILEEFERLGMTEQSLQELAAQSVPELSDAGESIPDPPPQEAPPATSPHHLPASTSLFSDLDEVLGIDPFA